MVGICFDIIWYYWVLIIWYYYTSIYLDDSYSGETYQPTGLMRWENGVFWMVQNSPAFKMRLNNDLVPIYQKNDVQCRNVPYLYYALKPRDCCRSCWVTHWCLELFEILWLWVQLSGDNQGWIAGLRCCRLLLQAFRKQKSTDTWLGCQNLISLRFKMGLPGNGVYTIPLVDHHVPS